MSSSYDKTLSQLDALFVVNLALMKSGVIPVNKTLMKSYLRVIKDIEKKQEEELKEVE